MTINKGRDFLERVGWTFIQTFVGVLVATNIVGDTDWKEVLYGALVAAGLAAGKVVIAQNVGQNSNGELLPGAPVIEGTETNG